MPAGILNVPYSTPALLATGEPAAGSTMSIYNTGGLTLADLYSDFGLTVPILNPLTANSAGRFTDESTLIWASDAQAYDVALAFSDGTNLTFDNIFVLEAQTNTSGFAPINSPNFTGVPTAPTPATNNNSNDVATTAFVKNQAYATIASPTFTGVPAAPTAAPGTSTTQLATTAFVEALATGGATLAPTAAEIVLPNGLILKTGQSLQAMTNPTSKSITFTTPFPTACIFVMAFIYNPSATVSVVTGAALVSSSTTGATFMFNGYQSGAYQNIPGFNWFALGY